MNNTDSYVYCSNDKAIDISKEKEHHRTRTWEYQLFLLHGIPQQHVILAGTSVHGKWKENWEQDSKGYHPSVIHNKGRLCNNLTVWQGQSNTFLQLILYLCSVSKTNIPIALPIGTLVELYFGLIGAQLGESMFVPVSLGKNKCSETNFLKIMITRK